MKNLIEFFEQYWGYTIAGGLTLGALVTNIVAFVKTIITNKVNNTQCSTVIETANELQSKLTEKDEQYENALKKYELAQEEYNKELERKQQEYMNELKTVEGRTQQITAVLFTAISYIIMGSKLDDETKLSVLNQMNGLLAYKEKEQTKENVQDMLNEAISNYTNEVEKAPEEVKVPEQINEAVQTAQTLFDKYSSNNKEV